MSKRIPFYHYICYGVLLLSMALPYRQYDLYSGGWFSTNTLVQSSVQDSGLEFEFCYVLVIAMLATSLILVIQRNLATAIIGLIFSFGMVLFLPLLAFALTFSLFGPERNMELKVGYAMGALSVLTYFGFTIVHLVFVVKRRRLLAKNPARQDVLND